MSFLLLFLLVPAHAATFTVNVTGDSADANPSDSECDVSLAAPGSQCTLRAAIQEANSRFGMDTIAFEIPCTTQICPAVKTIQPATLLPTITDGVIIDGTTQSGYTSRPIVQISDGGGLLRGFHITGGGSTVRGLIINGFGQFPGEGSGILIEGDGGNVIQRSWIGTNFTGTSSGSNGTGIRIRDSVGNTIGGPSARNVISGNYIGIAVTGAASNSTTIGSNYIGPNESGTGAIGGQSVGIFLSSSGTVVGGASGRNVISGNETGIVIYSDATGNTIAGNDIGTSANGTSAIANVREGILLNGSDNVVHTNIISGNERGIVNAGPAALRNRITGNYIGLAYDGITRLPNVQNGVLVSGGSATVGTPSSWNAIVQNGGAGVAVTGNAMAQIYNRFLSNGGLAIDLAQDGVTPNDAGDGDTGPNNLLNFPVITRVIRVNGTIQVTGTASSRGIMHFFANHVCDSTGYGEGWTDGVYSLSTTGAGSFVFYSRDDILPAGGSITATISDITEVETDVAATSEFSACAQAVAGLRGDVNGDGTITVADVFFLINHLFANGPVPVGFGDVNADRSLGVSDVFYLVNYLFAGGAAPPP